MVVPRTESTDRPRLVFDDDCGFCAWSVRLALRHGDFAPVGYSELTPDERARLPDDYERCMHLLDGAAVFSCGAAAERTVERAAPLTSPLFALLRRTPGYPRLREGLYRWIADRRSIWGRYRRASPPSCR